MKFLLICLIFAFAFSLATDTTKGTTTTTNTTTSTTPAPTTTTTTPRPIEDVEPTSGQVYGYYVRVSDLELECTPTEHSVNEDVYGKRHEGSFEGNKLELFQKDQFKWTDGEYKDRSLNLKYAVFAGFGGADGGDGLFLCRPVDSSGQVGVVSLRDGHCRTVAEGGGGGSGDGRGRSSATTRYQLLVNPKRLKYRWEDIEDWSAVPFNAVAANAGAGGTDLLTVGSNRTVLRPTFIGRLKRSSATDAGSVVLRLPSRRKAEDLLELGVVGSVGGATSLKQQLLVVESTASEPDFLVKMKVEEKQATLRCQIGDSNRWPSDGSEEHLVNLRMIKMKSGGEVENKVHWQIFRKSVSTTTLFWLKGTSGSLSMVNPVLGGLDDDGLPKYLCQAEHRSTKIPGFLNLVTGSCDVTYGHSAYEKSNYKVLYNPGNVPLVWKPFKAETRGQIGGIIGGREDGAVYYFGKVVYKGKVRFGKVQSKSDTFYFADTKECQIDAEKNEVKILVVEL